MIPNFDKQTDKTIPELEKCINSTIAILDNCKPELILKIAMKLRDAEIHRHIGSQNPTTNYKKINPCLIEREIDQTKDSDIELLSKNINIIGQVTKIPKSEIEKINKFKLTLAKSVSNCFSSMKNLSLEQSIQVARLLDMINFYNSYGNINFNGSNENNFNSLKQVNHFIKPELKYHKTSASCLDQKIIEDSIDNSTKILESISSDELLEIAKSLLEISTYSYMYGKGATSDYDHVKPHQISKFDARLLSDNINIIGRAYNIPKEKEEKVNTFKLTL